MSIVFMQMLFKAAKTLKPKIAQKYGSVKSKRDEKRRAQVREMYKQMISQTFEDEESDNDAPMRVTRKKKRHQVESKEDEES
jgi:hypothetical protein